MRQARRRPPAAAGDALQATRPLKEIRNRHRQTIQRAPGLRKPYSKAVLMRHPVTSKNGTLRRRKSWKGKQAMKASVKQRNAILKDATKSPRSKRGAP